MSDFKRLALSRLAHAEQLLNMSWCTTNPRHRHRLTNQTHQLLLPLVSLGIPHAQYLHASRTLELENLDEAKYNQRHYALMTAAAHAGHAKAQFRMGQAYDDGGDLGHDAVCSANWFRLSAEQGYAYAQWVHGLNLLIGTGIEANQEQAQACIHQAAEGKFVGALEYLAEAYQDGIYDYPQDLEKAARYRHLLTHPDVMSYLP